MDIRDKQLYSVFISGSRELQFYPYGLLSPFILEFLYGSKVCWKLRKEAQFCILLGTFQLTIKTREHTKIRDRHCTKPEEPGQNSADSSGWKRSECSCTSWGRFTSLSPWCCPGAVLLRADGTAASVILSVYCLFALFVRAGPLTGISKGLLSPSLGAPAGLGAWNHFPRCLGEWLQAPRGGSEGRSRGNKPRQAPSHQRSGRGRLISWHSFPLDTTLKGKICWHKVFQLCPLVSEGLCVKQMSFICLINQTKVRDYAGSDGGFWRAQGVDPPAWLLMTHICFCCSKMKHPGGIHAVLTMLSKQDGSCLFSQWMQNFSSSCLMETWSAAALQIRAEWNNSCRVCRKPQSQWCAINIYTSVFVSHYSSPPPPTPHTHP